MTPMWWISIVFAQDVDAQAARIRQAMEASLEKQRISVQQQAKAVTATVTGASVRWRLTDPIPRAELDCDPVAKPELDKLVDEAARDQQIEPALVREVARQESAFYPCAVSPKGAAGLMQLMPETQAQFQVQDPMDPKQSLNAGAKLLKQLIDRYHGDLSLALSAYNAGASRVDQSLSIPGIAETKQYVSDILGRLRK